MPAINSDPYGKGPISQMVRGWNLEWLNAPKGHWGDKIDWTSAREIARRLDQATGKGEAR